MSLLFSPDQVGVLVHPEEITVDLMTRLGFALAPDVADLELTGGTSAEVSRERVSLLEADVTLVFSPDPELVDEYLSDPLVERLDVAREGRIVEVDPMVWNAFRNPSALAIPYAVDQVVATLEEIVPA